MGKEPFKTTMVVTTGELTAGETFNIKFNPVVQELTPSYGPTTGGSVVVVVGQGLAGASMCSFGNELTPAKVLNDLMVQCKAPYHVPGAVAVKIQSTDGNTGEKFTSSSVDYTYKVMNTRVDNIHPSSGSISGGVPVTVRGSGFTMGSFCRFGDTEVAVQFFSSDHVQCTSPERLSPSVATLEVSQTGHNEGYSEDGHKFTWMDGPSAHSVEPTYAPALTSVTVRGSLFTSESKCYFGGRPSGTTTFVSDTKLQCTVPALQGKSQETVSVSDDPNNVPQGTVVFKYRLPVSTKSSVAVREVVPAVGPTSGGTVVVVHGLNFPNDALCRFGDLYVTASVLTDKTLQCTSPQHRASSVSLEVVSGDRAAFSSSLIKFTFQSTEGTPEDDLFDAVSAGEPQIERLEPTSQKSKAVVTLIGERFSSVGFCIFSDESNTQQVRATIVNSAQATCVVPELPSGAQWAQKTGNAADVSVKFLSLAGIPSQALPFKITLA